MPRGLCHPLRMGQGKTLMWDWQDYFEIIFGLSTLCCLSCAIAPCVQVEAQKPCSGLECQEQINYIQLM